MTKKQEIAHVRALIKTLGPDTYLGPWLQEVVDQVEQYIASDIFPDISLKECAKIVKENMERCKIDCDQQRERAYEYCKMIGDSARNEAEVIKQKAYELRDGIKAKILRIVNEI